MVSFPLIENISGDQFLKKGHILTNENWLLETIFFDFLLPFSSIFADLWKKWKKVFSTSQKIRFPDHE